MLNTLELTIKGKEYKILKPKPVFMIELQDKYAKPDGSFDSAGYIKSVLELVDRELTVEDLVTFRPEALELDSGAVLKPYELGYDKWTTAISTLGATQNRVKACKMFLECCGSDIDIDDLSFDDINACSGHFYTLYDESELNEVVLALTDFR